MQTYFFNENEIFFSLTDHVCCYAGLIETFQVDKDKNGAISLSEYFAIFEDHGITVNKEMYI